MKAPDRIFFTEDFVCGINCNKPVPGKRNVEYIRKEALMEWASGELMLGNSGEGKGWNLALQTLIDKLNSM